MLLIPELGRQKQADLCEFKASLIYRASSRSASVITQRNPVPSYQKEINGTAESEERGMWTCAELAQWGAKAGEDG